MTYLCDWLNCFYVVPRMKLTAVTNGTDLIYPSSAVITIFDCGFMVFHCQARKAKETKCF